MRWLGLTMTACVAAAVGLLFGACSASSGGSGEGGLGTGATAGAGGLGFGAGGQGGLDAGATDAADDVEICSAVAEEAQPKLQPADIVFIIDTSGSMGEESKMVHDQMNIFSQQIMQTGIEVMVVLIAEEPDMPWPFPPNGCMGFTCEGMCIDPPLGSGVCPDDENPPYYFHIKMTDPADSTWGDVGDWWEVYSDDGLYILRDSYNDWGPHLRADATKTFVAITDDDARMEGTPDYHNDPQQFIDDLTALDPLLQDANGDPNWRMSGITCHTDCNAAAMVGTTWQWIINETGGIAGDLCAQDFQPTFDDLATAIIIGAAELDCQWDIPAPPEGETLDPTKVNVEYTDGNGNAVTIYNVADEAGCDPVQGGWYYDDNVNPTTIFLCAASCDMVKIDPDGRIDILFGCATEPLPPPT